MDHLEWPALGVEAGPDKDFITINDSSIHAQLPSQSSKNSCEHRTSERCGQKCRFGFRIEMMESDVEQNKCSEPRAID
ncbi:hypothetical protein D3C78_1790700 [compost metagenome]